VNLDSLNLRHLYEDSRAVIAMAENPSKRKGARHIVTREHFADQLVKDCMVKLVQCRTNKMVEDALRKNLQAPAFEHDDDDVFYLLLLCVPITVHCKTH
jgi:hypothetical protein